MKYLRMVAVEMPTRCPIQVQTPKTRHSMKSFNLVIAYKIGIKTESFQNPWDARFFCFNFATRKPLYNLVTEGFGGTIDKHSPSSGTVQDVRRQNLKINPLNTSP